MALDAYMYFNPTSSTDSSVTVTGETTDAVGVSANSFEIASFKWGASSLPESSSKKSRKSDEKGDSTITAPVNLAARSVTVDKFSIKKPFDTASLGLFLGCVKAQTCVFALAQVVFRKFDTDGTPFVYLTFEFKNVRVDKIEWDMGEAESGSKPSQEDVDFSFDICNIYYTPQTSAGAKQFRGGKSSMKTAGWSRPAPGSSSD
jgi:type VI protein secretion system component Hcp